MYLFGASGHGKVIKNILNANGIKVEALWMIILMNECGGRLVLHDAMGFFSYDCEHRCEQNSQDDCGEIEGLTIPLLSFATAIHPSAVISPSAKIGEGTVVMAGQLLMPML